MLEILVLTVFPALMIAAALFDLTTMTIPNWLNLALLAGFPVLALLLGLDAATIGMNLLVGLGFLIFGIGLFGMGYLGGGDAKLLAATALWFGWSSELLYYLVIAAFIGGALALAMLLFRQFPLPMAALRQAWLLRLHNTQEGIPYGLALAMGGLLTFPDTVLFSMAVL